MLRPLCAIVLAGCLVGPRYHVPPARIPAAGSYKGAVGWKVASPADAIPRGKWWTMFHEPELDALEARLNVDNQSIAQAVANYATARAQIRGATANYFPTVTVAPSATAFRTSASGVVTGISGGGVGAGRHQLYTLPLDVAWAPDLFGRVRYAVDQSRYAAQLSAADLENTRLLVQSLLAQAYFEIRGQDALVEILDATVTADTQVVELTRTRFQAGIAEEVAVVQAELTLQLARVQASNAAIERETLENAIATLVGIPATDLRLPRCARLATPPAIPLGAPSQLLERRPDIAAAERAMAAANAAIGLARTAYFPLVSLTGTGCSSTISPGACVGFVSTAIESLLSWPSRAWALGATVAQVLFDGGQRRANVDQSRARYDAAVAAYRQAVLAAIQEVEDGIAQSRGLALEIELQRTAVSLAQRSFDLELERFEKGLDPYINLMLQQTALLAARQALTTLQVQQITAAVSLVQALGGGWDRSDLPPP